MVVVPMDDSEVPADVADAGGERFAGPIRRPNAPSVLFDLICVRLTTDQKVGGSNPPGRTTFPYTGLYSGSLVFRRGVKRPCEYVLIAVPLRTTVAGAEIPWDRAVDAFLDECRGNGLRPATLETYRWFLTGKRAAAFRRRQGIKGPRDITADQIEQLKSWLLAGGMKPSSVDDWRRTWRVFLGFCDRRGWLIDPSALTVRAVRQPKHAPEVFTADEERRLLAACGCPRDRFLVLFAIETGLRRSELVGLTIDDFIPAGRLWIVRVREGKGGKERGVPLSDALRAELTKYLTKVRPQQTTCRSLFLTLKRSSHGDYAPLTGDGLYRLWHRLSQATGIRAFPHKARHTFGTRLAADGVSPWVVRESLGHETFAATDRYIRRSAIHLVSAFADRGRRV